MFCGCSPLFWLWSRKASYFLTSAAQYWASLDWANAAAGSVHATMIERLFRAVVMASSVAH
jgi:hypothetical protein